MANNPQAFLIAIQAAGLTPPEHIEPGRFYRFPGINKRNGNQAGWCKLFADGQGGTFGDYSTGLSESWQAEREQSMTKAERDAFRKQVEASRKRAEQQRRQEQEAASTKARQLWEAAQPAKSDHPYLAKKHVQPHGIRQEGDKLLVPLRDESGQVWALQTIGPDGDKLFSPAGCRTKGLYFSIGQPAPGGPVCIVEGFATGAAIHEATVHPVACAMTAGNLETVARIIKAKLPDNPVCLCADDDQKPDSDRNPGVEAATKAALAVGGLVAVPAMDRKADFWDLWHEQGPGAVRAATKAAASPVADQQGTTEEQSEPPADLAAVIQQLAGLSDIEYELKRKEVADTLGIRATALDQAVKKARKGRDENDLPFDEPEPWPVPVEPGQLLTDIATTIQRFVVCSDEVAHTVALWSAMTWFMDVVQVAPLAVITAPEKRCGKSQLLFLLGRLSSRSITASSISPAALYRAIDAWNPTLLIDEADAFMKDNEELRGIINSGHTRDSAYVIRTVGDEFTPTKFNTWGAKAIAGIGHVADTLMDRAVILELRRKLPHEEVDRLRYAEPNLFDNLRSKLARFASDYSEQVRQARPLLPQSLNDRAQDNWEPLLAIAAVVGGNWLKIGTAAALKLSGTESAAQTIGTELLADIKEVFEELGFDRISTAELIKALTADDEKMWATYNRGNPIRPRQIANKLKGYGITSTTLRFRSSGLAKGYERDQFEEAFSRYIPCASPPFSIRNSATNASNQRDESATSSVTGGNVTVTNRGDISAESVENVTDKGNVTVTVTDRTSVNLLFQRDCYAVTDRTPLEGDSKAEVEI